MVSPLAQVGDQVPQLIEEVPLAFAHALQPGHLADDDGQR
jgi:hypothetical protein